MTDISKSILKGAREALDYSRGHKDKNFKVHIPEEIDVKSIRNRRVQG